jgi:hypothetical protein
MKSWIAHCTKREQEGYVMEQENNEISPNGSAALALSALFCTLRTTPGVKLFVVLQHRKKIYSVNAFSILLITVKSE